MIQYIIYPIVLLLGGFLHYLYIRKMGKKIIPIIIPENPLFADISFPETKVSIDLSDKIINNTTIKRQVVLNFMMYNQTVKFLSLTLLIKHFATNKDGSYGESISSIAPDIAKQLIINDQVIVDISGNVVNKDALGNYPAGSMGQYTWFNQIFEKQDVNLHNILRKLILSGDLEGKSMSTTITTTTTNTP